MAILTTGNTFADGDQVTSTKLNNIANGAAFASGSVDDSTTQISGGAIIVKDLGISAGKIAASAVTTAKIADSNVTKAKIENVANLKVLGNVSGSAAAPAEVAILDEDNMASNSATSLATQQSIKAYADSKVDGTAAGSFTSLSASGDLTVDTSTLKVDSSNDRVGIGTASPLKKLHIASNANDQTTDGIPGIRIENTDTTARPDDVAGEIEFFSKDASEADKISGFIKNVAENAGTEYGLAFGAKTTGSNATEAVRINSSGNVGIGTATPTHKFHVVGEARFGDGGSVNDDLILKGSETATVAPGGSVSGAIITTNGTGSASGHVGVEVPANDADDGFFVATDANLDGTVDKIALKIKANGNVGIGETVPSAPLTVTSTTGGVILPRMTTTQMNAISSPANGEMIYNTTASKFYGYAGGAWVAIH